MLARKYDTYAYEQENIDLKNKKRTSVNYDQVRKQFFVLIGLAVFCYFSLVSLSAVYVAHSNALVQLKITEENLLAQNEALKIDVDTLKNPSRISEFATTQLGMSTARSNIYVQADKSKISYNGYAYAK